MSTILNTLKKLEEEKSVLEKSIDLKSLVLQGENRLHPCRDKKSLHRIGLVAGLVFGGVFLGTWGWMISQPDDRGRVEAQRPGSVNSHQAAAPVSPRSGLPSYSGIPLANIADTPPTDFDIFNEGNYFPADENPPHPPEPAPANNTEDPPEASGKIQEIDALIKNATQSALQDREASGSSFAENRYGSISGLKVKGIIFFASDSPSNYILVSTPALKNRKLKVGDTAQGATLQSIHPNKAIFTYQSGTVELGIGR
ncbi:MAG: hypothetical protein ACE5E9_09720 [Nitrospinaceae bacterium]